MLATYRSYGACWTPAWGCMLATYRSDGACWIQLGAVCWQPTGLMALVVPSLGLYMLGAVCWQPTGLLGHVEPSLGLFVGNLQVLWVCWTPAWGCMLATYRSYGACWAQLGAVCWQPTDLMGLVGPSLGLYVGNLQVLTGLLDPAGGLYVGNLQVIWGLLDPSLGLYVGNLQVLWGLLGPAWGCMLATYRSNGACWTQLGAVCWQPTGLMGLVRPSLGLYVGNLQVLWDMLDPAWG